jgi:hypothetical protein
LNKGDFIKCNTTFDSSVTKKITGVFATTNLTMAKFFGIRGCLEYGGTTFLRDKKIYIDNLRDSLLEKFYIYSVNSIGFIHDRNYEYIRYNDTKINNVSEFDLANEIDTGGWEIYLLNDKLQVAKYKQPIIGIVNEYIKSRKYKRVDILKIIHEQREVHNLGILKCLE